jgi:hypothetical protein
MIFNLYKKKTYNISSSYLFWGTTIFIVLAPIFLSFNSINDFTFSRITYPGNRKDYFFTLPVSFLFFIPILLLGLLKLNKDLEISLLFIFILFGFINYFLNKELQIFLLLAKIAAPVLMLLGFQIYIQKKFLFLKKKNIHKVVKEYNHILIIIFVIIFFVTLISQFYTKSKFHWLIDGIVIYNYHQYFSLIFILLLGILADNNQRYMFLLVYILSYYLYSLTTNDTNLILLFLFGIFYLLNLFKKGYLISLSKIFNFFVISFIFIYPFSLIIFFSYFNDFDFNTNLLSRYNIINMFFEKMNFIELLIPIKISSFFANKYYHNEFIVITSTVGLIGAFLFYYIFFKRIWLISKYYPYISISISLFSILSGITITTNLHPYTLVISSFFISYYYVLSKIKSQKFM